MPTLALYKAGKNIFLRLHRKRATDYMDYFRKARMGSEQHMRGVTDAVKTTGFSPSILNDMATERLAYKDFHRGGTAKAMKKQKALRKSKEGLLNKALKKQVKDKDWTKHILPEGSRGTNHWGHIKPRVPTAYDLAEGLKYAIPIMGRKGSFELRRMRPSGKDLKR
tara:strand:+ start:266 stop:763 length:498 start_codon:yes stop_codon:yes gene_type:complete